MNVLETARARLVHWLVAEAYPLWSRNGVDPRNGGFVEALDGNGAASTQPRRARVHPRQAYAFARARGFGWCGDAAGLVGRGMDYFMRCYRRPDGLLRTLADADGSVLDDRALLYDQAFALLGYAAAAAALDARGEFEARALELRHAIEMRLGAQDGAFYSDEQRGSHRESNPHMHLLEAYLAWAETGRDSGWAAGASRLAELALSRLIGRETGAIGESYLATWQAAPGMAGRRIEPGHQYEWAWLLLRCERRHPSPALRAAALRLIDLGERFGVHHGGVINALFDDFTIQDARARLWPQCERLKAALFALQLAGEPQYRSMAEAAVQSLFPYLNTTLPGLWLDLRMPNGDFADSPSPASSFYHLVGAIAALDDALGLSS